MATTTPKYTLIVYGTDHGTIAAVAKTENPKRIVFGFTSPEDCIEYLKKKRQKRYLLDGNPVAIPSINVQKTNHFLENFLLRVNAFLPASEMQDTEVLTIEMEREVEHCPFTDTESLHLEKKGGRPVLTLYTYSGFNGSHGTYRSDRPEDLDIIVSFLKAHADAVICKIRNLSGDKFIFPLGTIELSSSVYVTDPCYATKDWCCNRLDGLKPGKWLASVRKDPFRPVGTITVRHENYPKCEIDEETDAFVCVDSGQAGFFDAEYFEKNQPSEEWYKRVCAITLDRDHNCSGTVDGRGAVSESGDGDGEYDCLAAYNSKGEIVGLTIFFLD